MRLSKNACLSKKIKILVLFIGATATAYATAASYGSVAETLSSNFYSLTKLITAASYIAGLAFAISSIMKFKTHKDNPTQVPVGTPVALCMVAASLLFMPSILKTAGLTFFSSGGNVASSTGVAWVPTTTTTTDPSLPTIQPVIIEKPTFEG